MDKRPVVLATTNRHKIEELTAALAGRGLTTTSLLAWPDYKAPDEDGSTFEANAMIKAKAGSRHTGHPTLSDDSGLVVPALGGAPGVHSARYAGIGSTSEQLIEKLLREMAGVKDRRAWFETVLILYEDDRHFWMARGKVHGTILTAPRGNQGFGYDPVFQPDGHDRSFAEMSLAEKNTLSHRSRALQELLSILSLR